MTDLEMTKMCAEGRGFTYSVSAGVVHLTEPTRPGHSKGIYEPLINDAQAMALVKEFRLEILPSEYFWYAQRPNEVTKRGMDRDLNRAIVECVAKTQVKK